MTLHLIKPVHDADVATERTDRLDELSAELDFELSSTDVDVAAASGNTALRAEFGDRLPVVLLNGREQP